MAKAFNNRTKDLTWCPSVCDGIVSSDRSNHFVTPSGLMPSIPYWLIRTAWLQNLDFNTVDWNINVVAFVLNPKHNLFGSLVLLRMHYPAMRRRSFDVHLARIYQHLGLLEDLF